MYHPATLIAKTMINFNIQVNSICYLLQLLANVRTAGYIAKIIMRAQDGTE